MTDSSRDLLLQDIKPQSAVDTSYHPLSNGKSMSSIQDGLGKPRSKHRIHPLDLASVIGNWLWFMLNVITVTTHLPVGWSLGYNNQLIVVGLLLSIQVLFLGRILPSLFVKLEAGYGRSTLQNYEMLMRYSIWTKKADIHWRATLILFTLIPIGLSIGYKRFPGGTSSFPPGSIWGNSVRQIKLSPGDTYFAIEPPPAATNNSLFAMINATLPFVAASSNDSFPPPFDNLPAVYGFNTMLLSNTSAAMLDAPLPANITSIQNSLPDQQTSWQIEADVNATVTYYNSDIENHRDPNDTWWESIPLDNNVYVSRLFNGYQVDLCMDEFGFHNDSWVLLGILPSMDDLFFLEDSTSIDTFKNLSLLFNTYREVCHGKWSIQQNSVNLESGYCNGTRLDAKGQEIITDQQLIAGPLFTPVIGQIMDSYATSRNTSAWKMPTWVVATAAMYWSILSGKSGNDPYMMPTNQTITRTVMNDKASLYIILAVLPALTTICAIISALLYSVPVDNGFGMISVLAGVNKDSVDSMKGAALSGELERKTRVRFLVNNAAPSLGNANATIEYVVEGVGRNGHLRHGQIVS